LGWHVYAGLLTSVAFAPAREAVDQAAILAALVFLALAVLSFLLHRQVVRPAWALTSAIVTARDDPRAPPAPVRGPAELARIAVEFNSLQEARARSEEALSQRVAELADARAELRRALVHFTRAQEEQRRLVAQTLHDQTVQSLIATSWSLEDLAEGGDPSRRAEVIERARTNLGHAVAAARSLIFALRPPLLDEVGLPAAVEQQLARLAEETGLRTSLKSQLEGRLPSHLETLAFRTTEEALRNIRLHARASSVEVHIAGGTGGLEVMVDDDGVGFEPATLSPPGPGGGRVGLVSMRETINMAGGDFTVGPRPAGGTRVSFSLPA
ncbi:MAG: ATP-binding protein, partial [Acidimicrobiia bacterium]